MKPREYAAKLAELEIAAAKAKGEAEHWKQQWVESEQSKGPAMVDALERKKLEKTLRIIDHITAGRDQDAIQELLQPMPVVIGLDIRFDESARKQAEEEALERFKKTIISAVQSAQMTRKE